MGLLAYPIGGFIVILLASCFLFAELLVKARGVLVITGSGLFIYYFSYFLTERAEPGIFFLLVGGLLLIIIDGKLLTTGIIGMLGFVLMLLGCTLPTPSLLYGLLVGIAFVVGSCAALLFRRLLPQRDYLDKLMLHDRLSGDKGYNSMNSDYHTLIGKTGKTLTPFHPVGTVKIDGKNYSAITDGVFLDKDTPVKVISVDGTKIFIDLIDSDAPV